MPKQKRAPVPKQFAFNRKDTAELFGVTGKTLDEWKLPKVRRGREVFYDIRTVYEFRLGMLANPTKLNLQEEQAALSKVRREQIELEMAVRKGNLMEAGPTQTEQFNAGRIIRDHIQGIPDRVSGELAAKFGPPPGKGQESVWQIINKEIMEVLEEAKI